MTYYDRDQLPKEYHYRHVCKSGAMFAFNPDASDHWMLAPDSKERFTLKDIEEFFIWREHMKVTQGLK